jgi:hypothetical protein
VWNVEGSISRAVEKKREDEVGINTPAVQDWDTTHRRMHTRTHAHAHTRTNTGFMDYDDLWTVKEARTHKDDLWTTMIYGLIYGLR